MRSLNPEADEANDAADSEPSEVEIVFLFPTAGEAGGFVDKLSGTKTTKCNEFVERIGELEGQRFAVVEANGSHELIARVVRDVVTVLKPKWVMSTGFGIALNESVRRGQIMVADRIVDQREYSLTTGTKMTESAGLRVGTLLTVETRPETTEEKRQLIGTNALACETQAAVIAEVCRLLKIRMMAVHVVAEPLNSSIGGTVKKVMSQDSLAGVIGAAAGALIEKPSSVKEFWHDKESSLRLSDRLAGFLVSVVEQLRQ